MRYAAAMRALAPLLLLPLLGCPGPGCPTQPHTDAARALRMHRSLHRTVRALRAEARVDQRGAEGRVRGTVLMFLARPDRVRFDAMTQFGPAAVLTSNGDRFQLYDMRNDAFLEGRTCPNNIARLLGIPMSGEEVARFLVGDTPRIEAESQAIACSEDGYLVTLTAADGRRQEIVLRAREADHDAPPAAQHLRLMRSEVFHPDGRRDWRATFEDHELVRDPADPQQRGVALPTIFRFEDPDLESDTMVRIKSAEIVVEEVADEVFLQTPPPGIPVEQAPCD